MRSLLGSPGKLASPIELAAQECVSTALTRSSNECSECWMASTLEDASILDTRSERLRMLLETEKVPTAIMPVTTTLAKPVIITSQFRALLRAFFASSFACSALSIAGFISFPATSLAIVSERLSKLRKSGHTLPKLLVVGKLCQQSLLV